MGLFDKIKKDLLNKAKKGFWEIVENSLDNRSTSGTASSGSPTSAPAPIPEGAPAADGYSFRGTTEEYIHQILTSRFPGYQIAHQGTLSVEPGAVRPSFFVYANGVPVLAIIICDKHLYGRKRLRITLEACQQSNLPVQCYYTQFRNDYHYVVQRLGQVLK